MFPTSHSLLNRITTYLAAAGRVHLFCNLQSRARTHVVLEIGLYELLCNSLSHPGPGNIIEVYENDNVFSFIDASMQNSRYRL
jgi:hypothetical protein